jgi:hypothetical protein
MTVYGKRSRVILELHHLTKSAAPLCFQQPNQAETKHDDGEPPTEFHSAAPNCSLP